VNEDKSTGSPPQEPPSSSNQRSVDFLDAFGGFDVHGLFLAGSIPGDKGLVVIGHYTEEALRKLPDNQRHHVTAATYPLGLTNRDDDRIESVPFIVFDDIGKKVTAAPGTTSITDGIEIDEDAFDMVAEPSWKTETRRDRYQFGYHFDPVLTPDQARFIYKALKRHPIFGPGLHAVGQYFRLPTGTNTKPDGRGFRTRLTHVGNSWTFGMFCREFGIDPMAESPPGASGAGSAAGETLSPENVKALLDLIPNNRPEGGDPRRGRSYDEWTRTGLATWGATGGEGFEQFDEWSQKSDKYDEAETRRAWDTYSSAKGSATTLRKIVEEIHGVDSPERQEAQKIFARDEEMFPDLDAETLAAAGATAGAGSGPAAAKAAGMKIDELLREIAKTQVTPKHHRSGDTPHWGLNGKVQTLREAAVNIVAPPTIMTPYERGVLSVLGGMPGLGKSLLVLQQSLAVSYGRKDLLRYGQSEMNFGGDVIYISNEDGLNVMKRRFKAWEQRHGLAGVVPPHEVIPLKSTLLRWDGTKGWEFECLEILEMVLGWVQGGRDIAMIVVDTLATSVTGIDENQAKDINPVMQFLDRLAKVFWASVVFIHHVNKGSVGDEDRSIVALKGSFAIGGSVRGAVTLTPANRGEVENYGWEGRDIVVEYVAKANDDRARYVACYYELTTEAIPVGDAVDPDKMVAQQTVVLEPIRPVKTTEDMTALRAWCDLIEEAVRRGKKVRRYAPTARNTGANSAHRVLGVSVMKADEIIAKLEDLGWVETVEGSDGSGHGKVPLVVMKGVK